MNRIPALSLQALLCSTALAALPASAQSLNPKDAYAVLESFITGAGGALTAGPMTREGEAVIAPGAVLRLGSHLEARFESLWFLPEGAEVAIQPVGNVTVTASGGGGAPRVFTIDPEGSFLLGLTEADMSLGLAFARLTAYDSAAPQGSETPAMTFTGLTGRLGLTLTEPHRVEATLRADGLDYDITMSDPAIQMTQHAVSRTRDLALDLTVEGLRAFVTDPGWVARAFADGFAVRTTMAAGRSESDIDQTMSGTRTLIRSVVESSTAEGTLADGMLSVSTAADGIEMGVEVPGAMGGQGSLARMAMGLEMPVIATPDDRRFGLSMALQELRIDPQLLAMIGAGGFAEDAASAELDVSGQGRWLVEITDDPDPSGQPIDFSSFTLGSLALRLGTGALTGSGSFALAPGALARAGDGPPEGEGSFTFDLVGGEALLNRLTAAGLLPAEQQFAARGFLGVLGRPVGEDHLRSEIVIRPGGQITVNGAPVPF